MTSTKQLLKLLYTFVLTVVLISCINSDNGEGLENKKIILYTFQLDSLKSQRDYELLIQSNDSLKAYQYTNTLTNEIDIELTYLKKTKQINWGTGFYKPAKEIKEAQNYTISHDYVNKEISNFNFIVYLEINPGSHSPTILFNENYGVLAIGNELAPDFISLTNSNNNVFHQEILEKLNY